MFPVDSLPASYYEEREAADSAKRLAHIQEQHAKAQAQAAASAQNGQATQRPSATCLQRPQMSRPVSSSVLGNIFQGFVKAASQSPPPAPAKVTTQAELEKMMERQKDADIVSFRAW